MGNTSNRTIGAVLLFALGACGGKTGIPDDRLPEDERAPKKVEGPCPDQHPCATEHCSLVVPAGALPVTAKVEIAERPQPAELEGETTAPFVCEITTSGAPSSPLDLTVRPGGSIPTETILFKYDDVVAAVKSSTPTGDRVQALVPGSGVYGVTRSAASWRLEGTFDNDPLSSATTPALLRGFARHEMYAAYWDGTHFFVANGPRILVWNEIPKPTSVPPIVIGAAGLDLIPTGTSSSKLGQGVNSIWSNGEKLVVATGARVLIWNAIPKTSFATADLVLGQQDFVSNSINAGGISASTLYSPSAVDSDGTRLLVADPYNNRVLAWSKFPTSIGEPATSVLGQGSFTSFGNGTLYLPNAALLDGDGAYVSSYHNGPQRFASLETSTTALEGVIPSGGPPRVYSDRVPHSTGLARLPSATAVFDSNGPRIGVHRDGSPAGIDFALGQPDPTRAAPHPVTGSTFAADARIIASHGVFLVADRYRVLVYDQAPTFNYEPASRVIGNAGFSVANPAADYRRVSARTVAQPSDVATNGSFVAVADRGNNRVLLYRSDFASTNAVATAVLGQPDDTSFIPNVDQVSPSARTLSGPAAVALDDSRVFVADTENHRVLVWPLTATTGSPATIVLGQTDFASRRPNHGNGDADKDGSSDTDPIGMFSPSGIATNGRQLFVSDRINHRILVWDDTASLASGQPASRVIGQPSFTSNKANHGGGAYVTRIDGFNLPHGIALDGSSLWVADAENNRVVRWDNVDSNATATAVVGQPDGTTVANPNFYPADGPNAGAPLYPAVSAESVLRPRAVAVHRDTLYISEQRANRIHTFLRSGGTYVPAGQLGQKSPTTTIANEDGIGPRSLVQPEGITVRGDTLLVADGGNNRVLVFDAITPDPVASRVLGQPSFAASGFNQSAAVTAGGATRPRGLFLAKDELFVTEAGRHRVVIHDLPLTPGKSPKLILGQADPALSLPNAGGFPTASSLSAPSSAFVDGERVVVADSGNNRVLLFARGATEAMVVLGQASFTAASKNRGEQPSASTLAGPTAAIIHEGRLYVADTGNHRVLVWNKVPTTNGQPADHVLGQTDFGANLANRGAAVASARSLNLPGAMLVDGTRLFVADTGNNRVLAFAATVSSDADPAFALGQQDFTSRTASADLNDASRLSGPVALASDGVNLFVADRDGNRIAAYDLAGAAMGTSARTLFNSNSGLSAVGPAGLAVERTALFTSRLFVADTNNDRVLVVSPISRLR